MGCVVLISKRIYFCALIRPGWFDARLIFWQLNANATNVLTSRNRSFGCGSAYPRHWNYWRTDDEIDSTKQCDPNQNISNIYRLQGSVEWCLHQGTLYNHEIRAFYIEIVGFNSTPRAILKPPQDLEDACLGQNRLNLKLGSLKVDM